MIFTTWKQEGVIMCREQKISVKRSAVEAGIHGSVTKEIAKLMLAARTSARVAASGVTGARRHLATAVETPFRIAAVDNGQPTSSVTIVVKAGSRYETTPGAAHVLKNFAFKVGSLFFWVLLPLFARQQRRAKMCIMFD